MDSNRRHQSQVQGSITENNVIATPVSAKSSKDSFRSDFGKGDSTLNTGLGFDEESQRQIENKWQRVRCYGFELSGFNCLAPINVYCEILAQLRVEALPNSPNHFVGLTNVRGNLVPVYQLEPFFARPLLNHKYAILIGNPSQAGALLIAQKPKQFDLAGFVAQTETEEFSRQTHEALPEFIASAVTTIYRYDNATWLLLNHATLFRNLAKHALTVQPPIAKTLTTESFATDNFATDQKVD